jgi:hypothetical protein
MRSVFARIRGCGLWAAAAIIFSTAAAAQPPLEAAVKAAYIYRFLEYVSWPAESFKTPDEPIVIGVTQDDEIAAELRRIARERMVNSRRMVVVPARAERDLAVHVLYVSAPDMQKTMKGSVRQKPVLIITDTADGLEQGATINFVQSEGRIKFEVSLDAAQRAGLTISSRLLGVAARIKKGQYSDTSHAMLDSGPPAWARGAMRWAGGPDGARQPS